MVAFGRKNLDVVDICVSIELSFQFKTKRLFELKNLRNTSHNNIKEPNIA